MHRSYLNFILQAIATLPVAQAAQIHWSGPCGLKDESAPMICGTLEVPLDYTDPQPNRTLTLDLAKVAAKNPSKKGEMKEPILFNFGGPGEDSLSSMAVLGAQLQATLGGDFDLITFNTRGVGKTLPFLCSENEQEFALLQFNHGTASKGALNHMWNQSAVMVEKCYQNNRQTGELLGTAFVARDIMQVVDALGLEKLNYWGFSYGTVLGATTVSMFPNRMGKVVLDGVQNAHEYLHGYDSQMSLDTDKVFYGFCAGCLAAPSLCPLAKRYNFPSEMEADIHNFLETLKVYPIEIPGAGVITYDMVKSIILGQLYGTNLWPELSTLLDFAILRNVTGLMSIFGDKLSSDRGSSNAAAAEENKVKTRNPTILESLLSIRCSDKIPRSSNLQQLAPVLYDSWSLSNIGGDFNDFIEVPCAQWKLAAKERYTGDFNVKTPHPILLIGNTFDPVTPLASAYNVSWGLEDSVVLEHHGYGHSSLGQFSLCTANTVRRYFEDGTLPPPGKICEPSLQTFTTKTWENVI
ncbi:hypothetical protein EYZ11_004309 [Aspergillus tanneri]|uniref:Uncharacterized protein n=1 Tax=Aspergillus tanneri TaxID=1220188 RepID=A0A4S3JRS6_9EURO|nr:uncharacterized protein ATNIH1004_003677 [Aspergillus tanneri]KAA8650986.1 hypothetical protein ATNIH1004_003677 [Aspergillus tanneri]THC96231.1 hypothetical protein EYZ11_004309 [Aspergillus tanneri]